MRSNNQPVSYRHPVMRKFIQHPVTLVCFAFALLIGAWSVIVTTAIRHRAESVPVPAQVETKTSASR